MQILKKIVGFETFLVIFLFSYQFKNTDFFKNLPDITMCLAFLLMPWGIWLAKKEGQLKKLYENKTIFLLLLFWAWMICSYFWSPQTFFSKSKLLVHSLFTMPVVFYASLFIAQSEDRLKRLFLTFVLFSLPILFQIFNLFFTESNLNIGGFIFGANYLITGQTLGLAMVILYTYALKSSNKTTFLYAGLTSLMAFAMLYTGGRGPLIATSLCLAFLTVAYKGEKPFYKRSLLFGGIITFTALQHFAFRLMGFTKESTTLERLIKTYDKSKGLVDESSALRLDYYATAWQGFQENIFMGLGIAGWPTYADAEKVNSHPHNIFLEIAAELGLVGLLLFGGACVVLLPKIWQHFIKGAPSAKHYILLSGLLFSGLNAFKSGDLNDNILLFFMLSLLSSALYIAHKKSRP